MNQKLYYLDRLVGRVFIILPLFEEDKDILTSEYILTLVDDIKSCDELFYNGRISEVAVKLKSLTILNNPTKAKVKSTILKCTNIISKEREMISIDISGQQIEKHSIWIEN